MSGLQNFDLGPSLVDEVMKAFGSSGQVDLSDKLPTKTQNTTLCHSDELKTFSNVTAVNTSKCIDDTAARKETFLSTNANCDVKLCVQTSLPNNSELSCPQSRAKDLKSNHVTDISSEPLLQVPTSSAGDQCSDDIEVEDNTSSDIWQQQQLPVKTSEHSLANIQRNDSGNSASLAAGSRYPAIIGNCSLSPRPVFPRDSSTRVLLATKRSPSSTLSSSSDLSEPAVMSSRVAASLVAASSSSLPARSSLIQDTWSKLPHLSGSKAPSGDSSDSETGGNLLQKLKGKASLSRLSNFRLSIDSRTAKSGLPTQNLNVNVHFFNRLREQELQNFDTSEDDITKVSEPVKGKDQAPSSSSVTKSKHLPSLRLDTPKIRPASEALTSHHHEVDSSSGTETVSVGTEGASPIFSSHHDEVARLSCRSTESHDSFSHDSEHSTQPSDEGVYSDDSVAASTDELRPRTEHQSQTTRLTSAPASARALGFADKRDIFWMCPVNFQDLVVGFETDRSGDCRSQAAERYSNLLADMCYEDRMECQLNSFVDVHRYFVLIIAEFHLI